MSVDENSVISPATNGNRDIYISVIGNTYSRRGAERLLKTSKIFNVFFREKPALMMIVLRNSKTQMYASSLAKQVDCTYSHVVKILQELEKEGVVTFKKQGRLKLLELTKKGHEIAEHMDRLKQLL